MSVANKLYDRSHGFVGDVSASNPPMLYVDGTLPDVPKGDAYEGRLQIHNNVGPCKVSLISGSLPNGYKLRVDNTTFQVVISWPAYGVDVVGIDNAGFGNGNDGSWDLGPGWSITNTGPVDPNDPLNTNEAKYADSYGLADITNNRYVPVTAGQSITANCDMNLGGSRSDGRILLKWYDSNRNYVSPSLGEGLSDNGTWQRPSVTGSAPQNGFVRISAHVNREHDNKPCWVDNFTWNYVQGSQGTNTFSTIPLTVQVTDQAGRQALWSGIINVLNSSVPSINNFNTNLITDNTGRVWTLTTYPLVDRWGAQPVTVPFWGTGLSKEGGCFYACPDTKNHDGTFDYFEGASADVLNTLWGVDAPGTTKDFCLELYVRSAATQSANIDNTSRSFIGIGSTPVQRSSFTGGCRARVQGNLHENNLTISLVNVTSNVVYLPYGSYVHYALTRQGDRFKCWVNGALASEWSGASGYNLDSTSCIRLGSGNGNTGSTLGWNGQIDNFRMTVGWCRYSTPFTPPSVPY